jgi:hypothetical protein
MVLSTSGGVLWGNLTGVDTSASSLSVALNGAEFPYVRDSATPEVIQGALECGMDG